MILYKFYKNNCPACYALSNNLMYIKIPNIIKLLELNVEIEENKIFAKKHNINKVPCLMFENGNKISGKIKGSDITKFIEENINYAIST